MNQETVLAIEHLKKGNVILYPTDTIWGLGCDPNNEEAVKRIFEIKKRPVDQPLILIVDSIQMLKTIVPRLHPHLEEDRKSTRLNSSHVAISYAVFCLKKK